MDFFATVRGDGFVSEDEGLRVFELLVPIVMAAPDDDEAISAATRTISRMPPDSLAAALLDWWFATSTGQTSPLGLAFHLPETVPPQLRQPMESVTALAHSGLRLPPAGRVQRALELELLLPGIEEALQLDSYGKSKLPREREVWSWLQDELSATVDALRAARPAAPFDLNLREYGKQMKSAGIDENSRRWNEMVKRAHLCVDHINHVVEVQRLVEPWKARTLPTTIDTLPAEVLTLGPIVESLLVAIAPSHSRRRVVDEGEVAALLNHICAERAAEELSWLASLCDGWLAATGQEVDGLRDVLARRQMIYERIGALRSDGVDCDDAELLLLEHDLTGAEQWLNSNEAQRKADRRAEAIVASLEHLDRRAATGPKPPRWEESLNSARQAAASGDLVEAERIRQSLDAELRISRRSDAIKELETIHADLEHLRAPSSLLAELSDHLMEVRDYDDRSPDTGLVERSRERLDSIRQQRAQDASRNVNEARELLEVERDVIPHEVLPTFELRLSAAEEELAAAQTMRALDLLEELVDDINAQRVHRWVASEGEESLVEHVINYCTQQVHFDPADVRRLYVADQALRHPRGPHRLREEHDRPTLRGGTRGRCPQRSVRSSGCAAGLDRPVRGSGHRQPAEQPLRARLACHRGTAM